MSLEADLVEQTRVQIYAGSAKHGHAPRLSSIARSHDASLPIARQASAALHEKRDIVLSPIARAAIAEGAATFDDDSKAIAMAHPFSFVNLSRTLGP